jgi:oligosaccharide repeat unit polymerase
LLSLGLARKRWYAPINLMTGVWLVSLIGYACVDAGQHPLSANTIWAVALWLIVFCIAAWSMQSVYIKPTFHNVESSIPARDIYYYFTLCTIPIMIVWVMIIIARSGGNPFSALRDANVAEVRGIRTAAFFVLFWMVSYIMELQVISRENIRRVVVLFVANFFYAFVSMGKMNFMILFLATVIILTERKIIRIWHLGIAFLALLVFFVGVQKIRGSYTNPRHFTALYLTTSLANLDQNVEPATAELPAENSCRLFYAIKSSLDNGKTPVIDPIVNFQWVQIGDLRYYSNTYTAIYPFYKDFGQIGVIAFALILGLLFGYLFKTAEDGSQFSLVLYAILSGTVVMQFIGDTFFMVMSQTLQYIFAALIPYIISKHNLFANTFNRNG